LDFGGEASSQVVLVKHALGSPDWTNQLFSPGICWSGLTLNLSSTICSGYFYETHHQLRAHLRDFVDAYNFARRLKTLRGFTHTSSSANLDFTAQLRLAAEPQRTPG
jgi:hypothetical protein